MQSQAEKTIREHNPRDDVPNRILVKGNDGILYPKNPDTNYISRFPLIGFVDVMAVDPLIMYSKFALSENNQTWNTNYLRIFGHVYLPLGRPYLLLTLMLPRHQTLILCQLKLILLTNHLLRNLVFCYFCMR